MKRHNKLKNNKLKSLSAASAAVILASIFIPVKANELTSLAYQKLLVQTLPRMTVDQLCHKISTKLSSVHLSDCRNNGFKGTGGLSVEGSPIVVKEYHPKKGKKPLSKVLLIGGIHGDEYSSVSIIFKWINKLDLHHSGLFHWRVVPLMNPDGLLRKTSQRMNRRGVDLNRNFPTPNWHKESRRYWVKKTKRNPRRYPGPSPLSEPESQWLVKYIDEFKPDVIVSVHAPYGLLDFDGPKHPPKKLGQLHLNLLGTYPGSLGNYAGTQREIPVVTIELPYAGIMPSKRQIRHIWMDLVGWLKQNAQEPAVTPTRQVQTKKTAKSVDPS